MTLTRKPGFWIVICIVTCLAAGFGLGYVAFWPSTNTIRGQAVCADGSDVVGVFIQAEHGASGFAYWEAKGNKSQATFSYDKLREGSHYQAHLGCAGSPTKWATDNWSLNLPDDGHAYTITCMPGTTGSPFRCGSA